jgi:hypothetical protein
MKIISSFYRICVDSKSLITEILRRIEIHPRIKIIPGAGFAAKMHLTDFRANHDLDNKASFELISLAGGLGWIRAGRGGKERAGFPRRSRGRATQPTRAKLRLAGPQRASPRETAQDRTRYLEARK